MNKPLLELTVNELLEKFGAGKHKPGSGSATALQGMLSAQLLHTVIGITNQEHHKSSYESCLTQLLKIDSEIIDVIYPGLVQAFQDDAILFDRVIKIRNARDLEKDSYKRKALSSKAIQELKPATEILLKIGDLCVDLAAHGLYVFDNAFKSAKGDSGVALNGAVAAIGGCLTILDLNLSIFGCDEWTVTIRETVDILRYNHESLIKETKDRIEVFARESREKSFIKAKKQLTSEKWAGIHISENSIESLATQAHNILWEFRDRFWQNEIPEWKYQVMKPEIALEKMLGYNYGYADLGINEDDGLQFQIAGQIDNVKKIVLISKDLNAEVKNFTAAHELGHALLHSDMSILHRDRPIDGTSFISRDIKEVHANKFAAYFLMPGKILKDVFKELFSIDKFTITNDTVFKFSDKKSLKEFKKQYPNLRSVSKFVAKYKGGNLQPLHKIFGVSVEAMAIRLEELGIVDY